MPWKEWPDWGAPKILECLLRQPRNDAVTRVR